MLTTFKKLDETALNPRVTIPVCDEYRQPSSSMCCFVMHQVGRQNDKYCVAFCSICTQVRLPLVQNDDHKQYLLKLLCEEHFNIFLSNVNFKSMHTLYDVPHHPYQRTGIEVLNTRVYWEKNRLILCSSSKISPRKRTRSRKPFYMWREERDYEVVRLIICLCITL